MCECITFTMCNQYFTLVSAYQIWWLEQLFIFLLSSKLCIRCIVSCTIDDCIYVQSMTNQLANKLYTVNVMVQYTDKDTELLEPRGTLQLDTRVSILHLKDPGSISGWVVGKTIYPKIDKFFMQAYYFQKWQSLHNSAGIMVGILSCVVYFPRQGKKQMGCVYWRSYRFCCPRKM